jgi:hypothetical protein
MHVPYAHERRRERWPRCSVLSCDDVVGRSSPVDRAHGACFVWRLRRQRGLGSGACSHLPLLRIEGQHLALVVMPACERQHQQRTSSVTHVGDAMRVRSWEMRVPAAATHHLRMHAVAVHARGGRVYRRRGGRDVGHQGQRAQQAAAQRGEGRCDEKDVGCGGGSAAAAAGAAVERRRERDAQRSWHSWIECEAQTPVPRVSSQPWPTREAPVHTTPPAMSGGVGPQ